MGCITHNLALHLRRLPKQHLQRQINRRFLTIAQQQLLLFCRSPHHRKRTPLPRTNLFKLRKVFRCNRQHVAFLRFVAPRLQRAQPFLPSRNFSQIKIAAASAILHQFRKRIREPTRTNIMDKRNWVFLAALPATINYFLRAPLHLCVIALHTRKIQFAVSTRRA